MELKQNVEAVELVKDLRQKARELREESVMYHVADLLDNAADMISSYIRKEVERG